MRKYQYLIAVWSVVFFCSSITLLRGQAKEVQRVMHKTEADSATLQFGKAETLVLSGTIANPKRINIKTFLSTYESNKQASDSIKVNRDGKFFEKIPIINRQNLHFNIDNTYYQYYVNGGDTLNFSWDDNDPAATFQVHNPNALKDTILQIETAYFDIRSQSDTRLHDQLSLLMKKSGSINPLDQKSAFDTLNLYYNESIGQILALEKKYTAKDSVNFYYTFDHIFVDNYFESMRMYYIYFPSLFEQYTLFTDTTTPDPVLIRHIQYKGRQYAQARYSVLSNYSPVSRGMYRAENFDYFKNMPSYREFLFDYLRFSPLKIINSFSGPKTTSSNFTQEGYYMGYLLRSEIMRDWYRAAIIETGFAQYAFMNVVPVYESFIYDDYKTPYFKTLTEHCYASVNKLAPGKEAPAFSLKDENGRDISLKDFRGKVVFMDFWGVGCGPCIADIQNNQAKLHEKYAKKDIVFLNICVDADNLKEFTNGLKKYDVKGINLWAKGWTDNSACQAYNIDGIPHYYIIGKTGNIINNNAPRMGEILETGGASDELDKALSQ